MTETHTPNTDLAQALLADADRLRSVLHAALDCVVAMNERGTVVEWNPAAERTFGYAAEDAIGRELAGLIVPEPLRTAHREGLARHLSSGDARMLNHRLQTTAVRRDGGEFPIELTITRVDVPGAPVFLGYLRDITDRQRAEADLRASRLRIVAAADEARRRIERDLHDGAQQLLVGLALTLRLARAKLEAQPELAADLLDEALADLATAMAELRELARGIHPAVLTEGGLEPALSGLAGRIPVPVTIERVPRDRMPAAVEATAYFVVAEALTNVARYAAATRAYVHVERRDDVLAVVVRDDGRGGADPAAGSGLRGIADRVAALGGRIALESPVGEGTMIQVELPCAW
jgi:PAS domain S-box-containing protein